MGWLSRFFSTRLKQQSRALALPPPQYTLPDHGIEQLRRIDPWVFMAVYQPEHRLSRCSVLYPSIVQYTQHLEQAYEALLHDTAVVGVRYNPVPTELALWSFFLNDQGGYTDPVAAVEQWRSSAMAFLVAYRDSDAPYGSPSAYRLSLLEQLLNNTVSLAELFASL